MVTAYIVLVIILCFVTPATGGATDACKGGILTADSTPRLLTSPGYPQQYDVNLTCEWSLVSAVGRRLRLTVLEADLDKRRWVSCARRDHMLLLDGVPGSEVLGYVCTYNLPIYLSTHNIVTVRFSSGNSESRGRGFKLEYVAGDYIHKNYSTLVLQAAKQSKYFTQPIVDYSSNRYITASWRVQGDRGAVYMNALESSLSEELNCDTGDANNYMEAFDGYDATSPSLGRWCGSQTVEKQATGSQMFIYLHARYYNTRVRFNIEYGIRDTSLGVGAIAGIFIGVLASVGVVYVVAKIACAQCSDRLNDRDEEDPTPAVRTGLVESSPVPSVTPSAPDVRDMFMAPPPSYQEVMDASHTIPHNT